MNNINEYLINQFKTIYNHTNNLRLFFAPGRVNLIGEHTDYNGGHVFPCALNIGTYLLISARNDKVCNFYSTNFTNTGTISVNLDNLEYNQAHDWANYPKGVITEFIKRDLKINHGFDMLFFGNIPNGAGLSSSASIEVVMATMLNSLFTTNFNPIDIALIGQAAENKYIGVNCGIMDQFASSMGQDNMAILLNCNNLEYKYAPLNINGYKLVIANTNKRRGLADSKYNERLEQCQKALQLLQQELDIQALGQIDLTTLEKHKNLFNDPIIYKRAKHAVSENQRTLQAVIELNENNLIEFGKLMQASHNSLRDDYEVTGHELDSLVNAAWEHAGCIGARMTGAGFGGCTINIVMDSHIDSFIHDVQVKYTAQTQLQADFYVVVPSDGAREIKLG